MGEGGAVPPVLARGHGRRPPVLPGGGVSLSWPRGYPLSCWGTPSPVDRHTAVKT